MSLKTPRHPLVTKLKSLVLTCLLLASGAAAVGARAWLLPTGADFTPTGLRSTVAAARPVTRAGGGGQEVPQTELVTVTPTGFDPAELTRPAGRFILAVENRSGLQEITLVLRDAGGREVLRERVEREQLDWSGTLELTAGTYLLSEEGHPGWAGRLILTGP